jgi:hypothetical protein
LASRLGHALRPAGPEIDSEQARGGHIFVDVSLLEQPPDRIACFVDWI